MENGFNNFATVVLGLTRQSGCSGVALSDGETKGLQQRWLYKNPAPCHTFQLIPHVFAGFPALPSKPTPFSLPRSLNFE